MSASDEQLFLIFSLQVINSHMYGYSIEVL